MTIQDIRKLLESTGYPVAYKYFATKQQAPYICFSIPKEPAFSADGKAYIKFKSVQIELYTDKKDISAEERVETVLAENYYTKSEIYIEDIQKFQIIYEIEV